jgi:hypothetical protein
MRSVQSPCSTLGGLGNNLDRLLYMDDVRLRIPSNGDLQWQVVLAFVWIPVGLLYRLGRCHSAH